MLKFQECTLKKTTMQKSQERILQKSQEWILSSSQPGVDLAEDPAPQSVEIADLDTPTPDLPPVEVETVGRS
jgi:hypothetical protein